MTGFLVLLAILLAIYFLIVKPFIKGYNGDINNTKKHYNEKKDITEVSQHLTSTFNGMIDDSFNKVYNKLSKRYPEKSKKEIQKLSEKAFNEILKKSTDEYKKKSKANIPFAIIEGQDILDKACKHFSVTVSELIDSNNKNYGGKLILNSYIKFEKSSNIHEALKHLTDVSILIDVFHNVKSNKSKSLFVMTLSKNQNKTKRTIYYPNVIYDINATLYVLEKWDIIYPMIKDEYHQQASISKELELDREIVSNGFYILSEYNLINKKKEKSRIYIKAKKN